MQLDDKQLPVFIIDSSALKDMFEGKNKEKSNEMLKRMKNSNDTNKYIKVITTLSSFLRAIFLSDSGVTIGKIQKVLSFLEIYPSLADFKNEEAVTEELIILAKTLSGEENGK